MGQPIDVALAGAGLDTRERGDGDTSRSVADAEPAACEWAHMSPVGVPAAADWKSRSGDERRASGEADATDALSVSEIVSKLIKGDLKPESVSPERRRECVAVLFEEGYNISDAAAAMRVSERTIYRDRDELRRDRAIKPTLTFGDELMGEYFAHTQTAIQRLRKLTRDSATPPAVMVRAEEAAARLYERFVKTAYQLKYIEPGERRLHRMREEAEAERVARRMAEGSSLTAEIAGPRIAALMGLTPTRGHRPNQPERRESTPPEASPEAPPEAPPESSPKAATPEAAPKAVPPEAATARVAPPAAAPSESASSKSMRPTSAPANSTHTMPTRVASAPPAREMSANPKPPESWKSSERPAPLLIETVSGEAHRTLPPYPELPRLRSVTSLQDDAERRLMRPRHAPEPRSPAYDAK